MHAIRICQGRRHILYIDMSSPWEIPVTQQMETFYAAIKHQPSTNHYTALPAVLRDETKQTHLTCSGRLFIMAEMKT